MGGNLHRGFESLPLRSADRCGGQLVAAPTLAALEVAEDAAQRVALLAKARVPCQRLHLPAVRPEPVELALPAPIGDVQPAVCPNRAPGGHPRLCGARSPFAGIRVAVRALSRGRVEEGPVVPQV